MYYFLLFFGVIAFLSFVALVTRRRAHARQAAAIPVRPTERRAETPGDIFARLVQGERKEDKPCVTPIDCVLEDKCAGHCGCR